MGWAIEPASMCPQIVLQLVICAALTGNIAEWKKKEGDEVSAGDSIAEVETDKVGNFATFKVYSFSKHICLFWSSIACMYVEAWVPSTCMILYGNSLWSL